MSSESSTVSGRIGDMKENGRSPHGKEKALRAEQSPIQWSAFKKKIETYFREHGASAHKAKINASKLITRLAGPGEELRVYQPGATLPKELAAQALSEWEEADPHKRVQITQEDLRKNPFNTYGGDNRRANEYLRAAKTVIRKFQNV
jgi:hypothetical protein